jgi:hypothetical protein
MLIEFCVPGGHGELQLRAVTDLIHSFMPKVVNRKWKSGEQFLVTFVGSNLVKQLALAISQLNFC